MKIFLDAGHNYSHCDKGAYWNGLKEQDLTFQIASKLKPLLENYGHSVKMSRNKITDTIGSTVSASLTERALMSNDWGADLFVSIHCNAYNSIVRGTEVLVYSKNSSAYKVAERVLNSIVYKLGTVSRGVKERPDLAVLKKTKAPALLVETAFIDNLHDAKLLTERQDDFAKAICDGIIGETVKKNETVSNEKAEEQTVMKLPNEVYVQEISPKDFKIVLCDKTKKDIALNRYFNCGFFTAEKGGKTIPVGNLASDGKIITQAKDNADWINLSKKALTTIYTTNYGTCGIVKTDNLSPILGLKDAVSGIPIIVGGKYVPYDKITAEGYFGNELYDTWHGFLGIRNNKLVYVAMKCNFDAMCWALVALGITDAIKLDGGGSFILKDCKELVGTSENRRINNIGVWEK